MYTGDVCVLLRRILRLSPDAQVDFLFLWAAAVLNPHHTNSFQFRRPIFTREYMIDVITFVQLQLQSTQNI